MPKTGRKSKRHIDWFCAIPQKFEIKYAVKLPMQSQPHMKVVEYDLQERSDSCIASKEFPEY